LFCTCALSALTPAHQCTPALRGSSQQDAPRPRLLVVGFGPLAAALLHCLPGAQLCGSLALPGVSLRSNAAFPSPFDAGCHVVGLSTTHSLLAAAVGQPRSVPADRATAWAATLLASISPAHVLLLDAVPPEHAAALAGQPLAWLQSSAHAARPSYPPLSPGPLVTGAAAALLARCEAAALPCRLVVHTSGADAPSCVELSKLLAGVISEAAGAAGLDGSEAPDASAAAVRAREVGLLQRAEAATARSPLYA